MSATIISKDPIKIKIFLLAVRVDGFPRDLLNNAVYIKELSLPPPLDNPFDSTEEPEPEPTEDWNEDEE